MGIDASIYGQIKAPQQQNMLSQFAQMSQIENAQNQNKLAELMYGDKQRESAGNQAVNDAYKGAIDPATGQVDQLMLSRAVAAAGQGSRIPGIQKGFAETDKAGAEAEKLKYANTAEKLGLVGRIFSGAKDQASYDRALATARANGLDVSKSPTQFDPNDIADRLNQAQTLKEQLEQKWKAMSYSTPDANAKMSAETSRSNNAATIANSSQRERMKFDRDVRNNPQDKPLKLMTELQVNKLRTDMGKDHNTASTMISTMEDVLDSTKSVRESNGLSAATGYTGKYLPSFTGGDAAFADTRLENLRAKITSMGKAAAAASGAIGPMAVQEWKILADQVAVIALEKGKGPLLEQIDSIEAQATGALKRIREKYENTRGEDFDRFPQFRELPAARGRGAAPVGKPAAGGNSVQTPDGKTLTFPNAAAAAAFKKEAGL